MRFIVILLSGLYLAFAPVSGADAKMTREETGQYSLDMQPVLAMANLSARLGQIATPGITAVQQYAAGLLDAGSANDAARTALQNSADIETKMTELAEQISFAAVQDPVIDRNIRNLEDAFRKFPQAIRTLRDNLQTAVNAIEAGDKEALSRALVGLAGLGISQLETENAVLGSELLTVDDVSPQHGLQRSFIAGNRIAILFFRVGASDPAERQARAIALPDEAQAVAAEMSEAIADGRKQLDWMRSLADVEKIDALGGGIGDVALVLDLEDAWETQFTIEQRILDLFTEAVDAVRRLTTGAGRPSDQQRLFDMDAAYADLTVERVAANRRRLEILKALQDPKL